MKRYKLKTPSERFPGSVVFVESTYSAGPLTARLRREDDTAKEPNWFLLLRSDLVPLDAPTVEGECPYTEKEVMVGYVRWRSPYSTGTNQAPLYVGGDESGRPRWWMASSNIPEDGWTRYNLHDLLVSSLRTDRYSIRTITGFDCGENASGDEVLKCAGITIVPNGVKLDETAALNCKLVKKAEDVRPEKSYKEGTEILRRLQAERAMYTGYPGGLDNPLPKGHVEKVLETSAVYLGVMPAGGSVEISGRHFVELGADGQRAVVTGPLLRDRVLYLGPSQKAFALQLAELLNAASNA